MPTINMHAAKSQLSNLVKRAHAGEDVLIARDGRPVVRLVRVDQEPAARQFGVFAGRITVPASFFHALPDEELSAWGE